MSYLLTDQIPVAVAKINSTEHPVKVGLSDAFMAYLSSAQLSGQFSEINYNPLFTFVCLSARLSTHPKLSFCVEEAKRRTIYEYHRVEIDTTKIVSRSAFEFTPLPSKYVGVPPLHTLRLKPPRIPQLAFNTRPATSA